MVKKKQAMRPMARAKAYKSTVMLSGRSLAMNGVITEAALEKEEVKPTPVVRKEVGKTSAVYTHTVLKAPHVNPRAVVRKRTTSPWGFCIIIRYNNCFHHYFHNMNIYIIYIIYV
jgi:hypothetical protein